MLVILFMDRNLSYGNLRHMGDVFEAGDDFTDGDISRIEIRGVIRSAKQSGEVIGRGSVGEEDTVQDCISFRRPEGFPDLGTTVGA